MRTNSKKPSKQRLYKYNISKHETHKLMSVHLAPQLRKAKSELPRSLPVRVGDEVIIVRGDYKGKTGKVNRTDPNRQRVYVDGIVNKKTDASEIGVPIHPSNLMITKYARKDKKRLELINRRILDEDSKIDIESVLAEALAEEEDLIEFEDDEFEDDDDLLLDEDENLDEDFDIDEDGLDDVDIDEKEEEDQ